MALHIAQGSAVNAVTWSSIDTVLLDMDGTLLDLHFDNDFWNRAIPEHYGQLNGLTIGEARHQLNPLFEREQGKLNWYCLDFWSQNLGFDVATLKRQLADGVAWRHAARDFLDRLKASHCDVILITNAHPETLRIKMERIDLSPWFNHVLTSHQFGAAKESPQFWEQLMDAHPFDRQRTLFVDDSESVLAAAERFGVAHLLTLRQPDSSQPVRPDTRYPSIHHFDEIFDGLPSITSR
jgi:HAD superfamily hydrolase (TIGR01509 family)